MSSIRIIAIEVVGSGIIRILAGYPLFFALTRLTSRPQRRHVLWLLFLAGATFYWAALLTELIAPQPFTKLAVRAVAASATASAPRMATTFTIPFAWNWSVAPATVVLFWVYICGVVAMLFRLVRRRRQLRKAISQSRPVSPALQSTFVAECRRLEISRCGILEFPGLGSPGTAYVWKPLVIIPEGLESYLDNEQFIDVLCHELIHVRRLDFLWSTAAEVIGCLLFFHPAVWLALRNLGRDRELACDMAVLDLRQGRRVDYALCLTRLARRRVLGFKLDPPAHLALLNSFLAFRVETMLAERRQCSRVRRATAVFAGVVTLVAFVGGWSALSFAIEVGRAPAIIAALKPRAGHIASDRTAASKGSRSVRPSTENRSPALSPPPLENLPAASAEFSVLPVNPSANAHTKNNSSEGQDTISASNDPRPIWDETPASTPVQQIPSWRKTVIDAAVGALGHITQGKKGDGDHDADDKVSKLF